MKGINTPGPALEIGGFASFSAPRCGVFHLAFPALAQDWNQNTASAALASLGNEVTRVDLHSSSIEGLSVVLVPGNQNHTGDSLSRCGKDSEGLVRRTGAGADPAAA